MAPTQSIDMTNSTMVSTDDVGRSLDKDADRLTRLGKKPVLKVRIFVST